MPVARFLGSTSALKDSPNKLSVSTSILRGDSGLGDVPFSTASTRLNFGASADAAKAAAPSMGGIQVRLLHVPAEALLGVLCV